MINKKIILFENKEECCGCTACYAICSRDAIVMQSDEEGFEYPMVDRDKCVGCGKCLKVCPMKD
ncbi:4Fe-4S dicluster-binding protein [Laedolimicola intestinihominis]|uniref:4Fe-4S dicluster-binding protein n=1 Tax=Laedolimicola intestinihominis TaxID=3133166 RepID=A0ABV1FF27_9FIRM